ncbi:MAG: CCA tRNA nucleotidyltransferase [bacterium]
MGLSVYLVGGSVRTLVEARSRPKDWDLVVLGPGDSGARRLAEKLSSSWQVREPVAFHRFGTYLVPGPAGPVEITQGSLRTGLAPEAADPLVRDSLTRDFTVNALYIDLLKLKPGSLTMEILDPTGLGLKDLRSGILRTPLNPIVTLGDDPLRILRAARLRSTGKYRMLPVFSVAAKKAAGLLDGTAAERLRDELDKLMMGTCPSAGLSSLASWGVFAVIAPEIEAMVHFRQRTPYHYPSLFKHTMRVVDRVEPEPALRWAALLHDCGKPVVRTSAGEVDRYFGHETAGANIAAKLLSRLRFGKKRIKGVSELIRLHMVQYDTEWTDRAVRRLISRAGDNLPQLLALLEADASALRLRADSLRALSMLNKRIEELAGKMPPPVSPVSGTRIMELLNIEAGPVVGLAKEALVQAVVEGDICADGDEPERFLVSWYKERGDKLT